MYKIEIVIKGNGATVGALTSLLLEFIEKFLVKVGIEVTAASIIKIQEK